MKKMVTLVAALCLVAGDTRGVASQTLVPAIPFTPRFKALESTVSRSSLSTIPSQLVHMPLAFTQNKGQWPDSILYRANAGGATMWFTPTGAYYQFSRTVPQAGKVAGVTISTVSQHPVPVGRYERGSHETMMIRASFVGCNPAPLMIGDSPLDYKCNYFFGNDRATWRTDVPSYGSVTYKDVYPGIDLKYYGDGRRMEYDFMVPPGVDYTQIRIKYQGAKSISVNSTGDLVVSTQWGTVIEKAPVVYQVDGSNRIAITSAYRIADSSSFGFTLESSYNRSLPVVIDPVLVYSSYLGGSAGDDDFGIAVDGSGAAYVTGFSFSSDFPTLNPLQGTNQGGADVSVTKIASSGNSLVYSTYLGGSGDDFGYGIAVDALGAAYITGITGSTNFPMLSPFQGTFQGGTEDAFVTKISSSGNSLVYSTYLGGSLNDEGWGIAIDGIGEAYVTGNTYSVDFPTLLPVQTALHGANDVFVTKLSTTGSTLLYSTYLGGIGYDFGNAIAIDGSGSAYVTGRTNSSDFPTLNPFTATFQGDVDAFITKLSPSGSTTVYSSFLGGTGDDEGQGIAVDVSNEAYVTGFTNSSNFPTHAQFQTWQGGYDAFVTKFSSLGNSLVYSTYAGGTGDDFAYAIAVDDSGEAYLAGFTSSVDYPTLSPYQGTFQGVVDAFITKLSTGGNSLMYSTYLGGSGDDEAYAIAVDASGAAYVTGPTSSSDFPMLNPFQGSYQGNVDVFVTKLVIVNDYALTAVDSADVFYIRQADLDMDNNTDVVYSGTTADSLYVIYGRSDGTQEKPKGLLKAKKAAIAIDYVNSDTLLDIVARTAIQVYILLNQGNRTFSIDSIPVSSAQYKPFSANSSNFPSIATGFFNNDGSKDIIVSPGTILFGNGSGGFPTSSTLPFTFDAVASADFNNDGSDDIVATMGDSVKIFLNNGSGTLTQSASVGLGNYPFDVSNVVSGVDFNKDGKPDFAVVTGQSVPGSHDTSQVTIVLGNGSGGVQSEDSIRVTGSAINLAVNDVSRDQNLDLTVVNARTRRLEIYLGNGLGAFPDSASASLGSGSQALLALVTADLNRDGNPDYVSGGGTAPLVVATNQDPPEAVLAAEMVVTGLGGVDFSERNPLDFVLSRNLQTISGSAFWRSDIDHDGKIDERSFDYNLLNGEYKFIIKPDPVTPPGSQFTFDIRLDGSRNAQAFASYGSAFAKPQMASSSSNASDSIVFYYRVEPTPSMNPPNGVQTRSQQPEFVWKKLVDTTATKYHFQLDRYFDQRSPIYNDSVLTTTQFIPPTPLGVDSIFYWRVQSFKNGVWSDWSRTMAANIGPGCCIGVTGNVNGLGIVDLSDLSALVSYLTGGGYVLPCLDEANVNGQGTVDLGDLSALVSYLTGGGFDLPPCP